MCSAPLYQNSTTELPSLSLRPTTLSVHAAIGPGMGLVILYCPHFTGESSFPWTTCLAEDETYTWYSTTTR
jgi:hypothetical protein